MQCSGHGGSVAPALSSVGRSSSSTMTPVPTNRADEDDRAHNIDPEIEVKLNGVNREGVSHKINSLVRGRKKAKYIC